MTTTGVSARTDNMVKATLLEAKYPVMPCSSRGTSLIPLFWYSKGLVQWVTLKMNFYVHLVRVQDSCQKHSVINRSKDMSWTPKLSECLS